MTREWLCAMTIKAKYFEFFCLKSFSFFAYRLQFKKVFPLCALQLRLNDDGDADNIRGTNFFFIVQEDIWIKLEIFFYLFLSL